MHGFYNKSFGDKGSRVLLMKELSSSSQVDTSAIISVHAPISVCNSVSMQLCFHCPVRGTSLFRLGFRVCSNYP